MWHVGITYYVALRGAITIQYTSQFYQQGNNLIGWTLYYMNIITWSLLTLRVTSYSTP